MTLSLSRFNSAKSLAFLLLVLSPSYLLLLIIPFFSDKESFLPLVDTIYNKYSSHNVQVKGGSVLIGSLSRREAATVKTLFLHKLQNIHDQKKILIFSNHQMQYITSGFKSSDIFNMWSGNFSINELADWISYLDSQMPSTLPSQYLVTAITTPNNDNGNYMVGYSGNLPAYIPAKSGKNCRPPLISGVTLKQSFEACYPVENIRYFLDYKTILSKISRSLLDQYPVDIAFTPSLNQPFSIDKTGASLGELNVGGRSLVFNEEGTMNGFTNLHLKKNNVADIYRAVLQIDNIAFKRGIKHIFVIPPVYESPTSARLNSPQNLIMDEALSLISSFSKSTIIIDDRRNPVFLSEDSHKYYYHYDHPSSIYGRSLLNRILKI